MKRLTERDEYGNADIIGVDCVLLQGDLAFEETNLVTEALNRLAEYEDIGLTAKELTAELAEKDIRIAELEAGQKHGKWTVEGCEPGLSYYEHTCTACKEKIATHTGKTLPYCPKCGAKMDGE